MNTIPKIIHQIWSDKYKSLPSFFLKLSQTWKDAHPDWKYIYWNEEKMKKFIQAEFPEYEHFYNALPFDMQRWDSIRFLILYKMGGMHVDFDYECWENVEPLLEKTCNIALEPETHCEIYGVKYFLNSALMASTPKHPFVSAIIDKIFSPATLEYDASNKPMCILNTTGPLMLSNLYLSVPSEIREEAHLIPAKNVTPFDAQQIRQVKAGLENEELETCLEEAFAIHYFSNAWLTELSEQEKSSLLQDQLIDIPLLSYRIMDNDVANHYK